MKISNNAQLVLVIALAAASAAVHVRASDDEILQKMLAGSDESTVRCLSDTQEVERQTGSSLSDANYDFLGTMQTNGDDRTNGLGISFPDDGKEAYRRSCSEATTGTYFAELPETKLTCNTYGRNVRTTLTNYAYCLSDTEDCKSLDGIEIVVSLLSNLYGMQCGRDAGSVANTTTATQMNVPVTNAPTAAAAAPVPVTSAPTAPADGPAVAATTTPVTTSGELGSIAEVSSSNEVDELKQELEVERTKREEAETELQLLRDQLQGESDNTTRAPVPLSISEAPSGASPSPSLRATTEAPTASSDGTSSFPIFNAALVGFLMLIAALTI